MRAEWLFWVYLVLDVLVRIGILFWIGCAAFALHRSRRDAAKNSSPTLAERVGVVESQIAAYEEARRQESRAGRLTNMVSP